MIVCRNAGRGRFVHPDRARRLCGFEPLEARELLSINGPTALEELAPVTISANSAAIVSDEQTVAFDPVSRVVTVGAPSEVPDPTVEALTQVLRQAGYDGIGDYVRSLGSPPEATPTSLWEPMPGTDTVHGADDRVLVSDTLTYPFSAVGRLITTFPDDSTWLGSGAMVSPYHFLTAGHTVHDAAHGGWATELDVSLAQDGTEKFYGTATSTDVRSYTGWTDSADPDHDWALITLDRNVGDYTGWLGYEWYGDDSVYDDMLLNTAGYPGDLGGTEMYEADGESDHATANRVYYSGANGGIDTFGGQSGSSVWRYDGSDRYVNAVHAYGGATLNSGTRITEAKFTSLQDWIAEDDTSGAPIDYPDLVDYDAWFGSATALVSTTTPAVGNPFSVTTYPRNNGTAAAGNFTVRYRLSSDPVYDAGDLFLGDSTVSSLNAFEWTTNNLSTTFPNVPSGIYYVVWSIDATAAVSEFLESNNTGTLATPLTVETINPDLFEDNNSFADATSLGPAGYIDVPALNIHSSTDQDYFSFVAASTGTATAEILFSHGAGDLDMIAYSSSFGFLGSSATTTDNELISFPVVAGETYYLRVYGYSGSVNGDYELVINGPTSPTGGISGYKWNDLDGEGDWDPGEPGLAGWTIYLDENQNGSYDPGEPTTVTQTDDLGTLGIDETGYYEFLNLTPGVYVVGEVQQPGWQQTYPNAVPPAPALAAPLTTTASTVPVYADGVELALPTNLQPNLVQSTSLINLDDFRNDARFTGIDGSGYATVIIDTGIDLNHPFFGPDVDTNGVADRIVYQYDFSGANDADATDVDGHGSNVSSIVASSDGTFTGMAPGADIIALKVFTDGGSGSFADVEEALQWVVANAATYNIASVNMSLGDSNNYTAATTQIGIGINDELAALAAAGVIVVSSAGNDFFTHNSVPGVAYPAADPNSLAVSAVWDSNNGGPFNWTSGATDNTTGPDRLTSFSQRHTVLTDIAAPGALITGANASGGTASYSGTSQAAPHIAGIAVLAQQLAQATLGHTLTVAEFTLLLQNSATLVFDGDDENDNVTNTNANYPRVDVLALAEAILDMSVDLSESHTVTVNPSLVTEDVNFGNQETSATEVVGRKIFYNQSKHDGNTAGVDASDDLAIATDKFAYLPGSGPSTFDNISSYSRGINGIIVDIANPAGTITAADFTFRMSTQVGANNTPSTWEAAPAPTIVSVRPGAGESGSDRVELIWDNNTIENRWLEVIVEGNDAAGGNNTNTGLAQSDVFFFGNRVGETGSGTATQAITSALDEIATRFNTGINASVTNIYDFDRSGLVSAVDALKVRFNTGLLTKINITDPPAAPLALTGGEAQAADVDAAVALGLAAPLAAEPADSGAANALPAEDASAAEVVFAELALAIDLQSLSAPSAGVADGAQSDALDDILLAALLDDLERVGVDR